MLLSYPGAMRTLEVNKDLRIVLERVDVVQDGAKVTFGIHSFPPAQPGDELREYSKANRLCRFRVKVQRREREAILWTATPHEQGRFSTARSMMP